jgi:4-carboxymuconolactone decarboxylase
MEPRSQLLRNNSIANAKSNGVTAEEMAEIITHAAFYAGWPNAWAVFPLAKEVYSEDSTD